MEIFVAVSQPAFSINSLNSTNISAPLSASHSKMTTCNLRRLSNARLCWLCGCCCAFMNSLWIFLGFTTNHLLVCSSNPLYWFFITVLWFFRANHWNCVSCSFGHQWCLLHSHQELGFLFVGNCREICTTFAHWITLSSIVTSAFVASTRYRFHF